MANNLLSTVELIQKANEVLAKHATELNKAAVQMESLNKQYKLLPSEYIKAIKQQADAEIKLNKAKQANITTSQKAADLKAKEARATAAQNREKISAIALEQKQIVAKERAVKVAAREQQANLKLASAWNQLNSKLNLAEKNYRDLATSQGLSNSKTKVAQREVLKLRNQVDAINKPIKRWNNNVGNYASSLRNLAGALGWAGVTYAMINGIKATYETIKAYDAINKSIQKVTSTQAEANSEFNFAIDISERYGLNLRQTSKDYVKFLASVKGTNLAGAEARKIFDAVSKSASSIGLSAEETSGTLRALNQIISKGKVQAEELRGQLGDRIPGAFQIMARAIGVTTAELDDMLKKGTVIADEVLPKFAAEMEKTFGVENVNRINTLVSAQNRLSTAWDKFIIGIENGDGVISKFIRGTLNTLASTLDKVSEFTMTLDEIAEKRAYIKYYDELKVTAEKTMKPLEDMMALREKQSKVEDEYLKAKEDLKNARRWDIGAYNDETKELFKLVGQKRAEYRAIEDIIELMKVNKKQDLDNKNALIDKIILKDKDLKQSDLEKMSIKELTTLYNKLNSAKGGGSATEKQVRGLKELKTALRAVGETFGEIETTDLLNDKQYQDTILDAQANLERAASLEKLREATKAYLSSFSADFIANSPLSSLGVFIDGTFDSLMEGAETSQEKFAVAFNAMADVAKQTFGFVNQLGEANFEAQYERLAREKEVALQFAGGSTAAREEIERQYEEKRAAIQRKQAESQKRMAIFNSIVGTAQAVVTTFAQLGFPAGIPAAAIMAGLGLAQTALIASQPIPQFWQGGEVGGNQQIMVNDDPYGRKGSNYKEVIEKPNGQILTPQGKNVKMTVPKGSFVHPTYDAFINSLDSELLTNNIMPIGASKITPMVINNGLTKGEVLEVMQNQTSRVIETINNQHGININIDETGINKYIKKKGGLSKVMNARFSGVGKTV